MNTFSIVIPMFNASKTIKKTLDSCLTQIYSPKEIIIVDDCSADDSMQVVRQWKKNYNGDIKIVLEKQEPNAGPSKARNRGWELASGEYISFLDADDYFVPEKLAEIHHVLLENKDIILLGHNYTLENKEVKSSDSLNHILTKNLLLKNLTTTPSVIVKREILERFDENMHYTEDHDLWLRITEQYDKTYFLDRVLTTIGRPVRSEGGQSANLWAMRKGEIIMYKKFCKRNSIMLLFPLFAIFSLSKHVLKMLKG